jgi:outer membrane protein TolC
MRKICFILILFPALSSVTLNAQDDSGGPEVSPSRQISRQISIDEYRQLALSNSLSIRSTKFDLEKSRQLRSFAFSKFFPQVKAVGGFLKPGLFGNGKLSMEAGIDMTRILKNPQNSTLNLDGTIDFNNSVMGMFGAILIAQPLFAGGRIVNSYRLAGKGVDASSYQLQITRNQVYAEAESKYHQLVVLSELIKTLNLYGETLDALDTQVSQALSRGVVARSDYLRVNLKKEEISIQTDQAKTMLAIAEEDFKLFAGIPEEGVVELNTDFGEIIEPNFDTSSFTSRLAERPEYRLLTIQSEAARLQEAVTIGTYMPSIEAGAILTNLDFWMDGKTVKDFHASYYDVTGFILMNIPISDWWGGYHKIKEASYSRQNAAAQLDVNTDYLLLDIKNKYAAYQTAFKQIKLAEIGLEYAEQNSSDYSDRYNAGLSVLGDYLEALALEQESKTKLNQAKADYFAARNTFEAAIGERR